MASIHKHTTKSGQPRYVVRWRDPEKRSKEAWFPLLKEATEFLHRKEAEKSRGAYIDPRAGDVTLKEVADRWLDTRVDRARATQDRDRSCLRSLILPAFGHRAISSILPSEVEAWMAHMGKAANTKSRALQILRSVLDLARRDRLIATNPVSDVKAPPSKPVRAGCVLSDEQMGALIAAAEEVDERSAIVVHLMARCGLRSGEAFALRHRDVDLEANTIAVRTSMSRREGVRAVKGRQREDEGRVIPIPHDAAQRLRRHLAEKSITSIDGFVVTAPNGGPLSYVNWRNRVWTRIVRKVDLELTPHDLRRTAATRLFTIDRWTPSEVQAYLGHLDPRVTLGIYTLVESESLAQPSTLSVAI